MYVYVYIISFVSTDSTVQRDYFASWLGLLLVDQYEVDSVKPSKEQVVTSESVCYIGTIFPSM